MDMRRYRKLKLVPVAILALGLAGMRSSSAQALLPAPDSGSEETAAVLLAEPSHSSIDAAGAVAARNKGLHLTVGKSMVVNTAQRLRRIVIGNPDVISSVTTSPWQVVFSARTAGASSVMIWDESGALDASYISSDLDVDALEAALKQALPDEPIRVAVQQDRILLSGTVLADASAETALKVAGLFSKNVISSLKAGKPRATQVQLKVRIVEVDRTRLTQIGFNFFSAGKNTASFSTGQFPSISTNTNSGGSSGSGGGGSSGGISTLLQLSDPLNLLYYNSDLGIGEAIKALEDKQVLEILAEPTITTVSGQKASFLSGGEFPFPVVQGGTGGLASVTVQFRPYGVKVDFTPVISEPGVIRLKVSPEVSALDFSNAVTISGYTIPALATRRAETEVELRDGQSFAISGLLDHRTTEMLAKTPGIGDIPILGHLFRSKSANHSVVELMVIVTPSIVDPLSDQKAPQPPAMPLPLLSTPGFDKSVSSQKSSPRPPVTAAPAGGGKP
jgi:pilus assembly protein CpaC